MTAHPLHLVRLRLESARLYSFAKHARLPARDFDEGYAVHALLAALFDHRADATERLAPKPFAVRELQGRSMEVLGYSRADRGALAARVEAFSDPVAHAACDLRELASRPMPTEFDRGTRLGFHVRVCPVRRVAKRGNQLKDRAEVDAFLARAWEVGEGVALERESVYRGWLAEELKKDGAASLVAAEMVQYRRTRLHRRTSGEGRQGKRVEHPDVRFDGVLEVTDSAAFSSRLARGLGRHRAFGFGMLLLKPAPRT